MEKSLIVDEPVGLLDASGGRGRFPGGLGGELLPGGLASGGLPRGLLGTGHGEVVGVGVGALDEVEDGLAGSRAKMELNERVQVWKGQRGGERRRSSRKLSGFQM